MGKVEKFVARREKEKHKTTDEFIDTLLWYVKAAADLDAEWARSKSDLNEAFNARMREIREEANNA